MEKDERPGDGAVANVIALPRSFPRRVGEVTKKIMNSPTGCSIPALFPARERDREKERKRTRTRNGREK